MVDAVDAWFAIPQRQGRPLPGVIAPIPLLIPGGFLVAALASPASSGWTIAAAWAVGCLLSAFLAFRHYGRCMSDAQAWSPGLAARYGAAAEASRRSRHGFRIAAVLLGIGLEFVFVLLVARGAPASSIVTALGILLAETGFIGMLYAECALPYPPDKHRVGES